MFDHVLASIRIGAADVDTRLDRTVVEPGERFSAQVVVDGGEVDQEIEGLELHVLTKVGETTRTSGNSKVLSTWDVADPFTIEAGERRVIDFEARLPPETPVTQVEAARNHAEVWIDTGLSIDMALDADDTDHLTVAPRPEMDALLDAITRSGYEQVEVLVDDQEVAVGDEVVDHECDQQFVYRPENRRGSRFSKVVVRFAPREDHTDVSLTFHAADETTERTMRLATDDDSVEDLVPRFREHATAG